MAKKVVEAPAGAKVAPSRLTGRLLVQIDPRADLTAAVKGLKATVLERLRIAIVEESSAEQVQKIVGSRSNPFVAVEEERRLHKLVAEKPFADSRVATWGVQAVNVLKCGFTGKGVKVAVLDTGFDFTHPDFAGRTIHRKSFIGRQAIDKDGHGTHCAGIAGGSHKGKAGARYGVASGARLYIGKILDDNGEGSDGTALAGIEWALEKGCRVISMSFGAEPEKLHSAIFEQVAQTVLAQGGLLIAATGNDSKRGRIAPVNHPANCPSVLAVGALTAGLKVAEFSCGGGGLRGGQVDLVAPGDQILSAKAGGGSVVESGTSMAAPFVAGMAALLWEQYPAAGAWEIWARLVQQARRLGLPASAVGAGLVYAGE